MELTINGKSFYLDGQKINIYSGAMHYFRIPCAYWKDRLQKLKAAGFNTVETYVAWNMQEPQEGQFCFDGQSDVEKFIKTAQEVGLFVIVRPGPYICAEWDFGGFPAWLLKYDDIVLRCCNERYIGFVRRYFNTLLPRLAPLQITRGGPIIMMQIENEYGSYARDKQYLRILRDLMRENGIEVLLFTSDGESRYHLSGGSLEEEFKVINFGGSPSACFHDLELYQSDKPLMCGEMWCGWFDHFREKHHHSDRLSVRATLPKILRQFFEKDANFNFYMFHGGTNFGCMAGANYAQVYQPTTTSYDYDAPLNEYGGYTYKYHVLRKLLCEKQKLTTTLPPAPETQKIGKVCLTKTAGLFTNLEAAGKAFSDHIPHYMEHYGQDYGLILYRTEIEGDYPDTAIAAQGVHDIAQVFVNGKRVGQYDRSKPLSRRQKKCDAQQTEDFSFPIPAFCGKIQVDILVEALGRVNFSKQIYDRKGLASVCIGEQYVYGFDVVTLPAELPKQLQYDGSKQYPLYMRGSFQTSSRADCFVNMSGFVRGYVFVNGRNLGRYWNVGPQATLYLPGVWLEETNEIVVLEMEGCREPMVEIIDHPLYI